MFTDVTVEELIEIIAENTIRCYKLEKELATAKATITALMNKEGTPQHLLNFVETEKTIKENIGEGDNEH